MVVASGWEPDGLRRAINESGRSPPGSPLSPPAIHVAPNAPAGFLVWTGLHWAVGMTGRKPVLGADGHGPDLYRPNTRTHILPVLPMAIGKRLGSAGASEQEVPLLNLDNEDAHEGDGVVKVRLSPLGTNNRTKRGRCQPLPLMIFAYQAASARA